MRQRAEIDASSKENLPNDWVDGYAVMQMLNISPRTLQTLRSNGTMPFSRIGNKLFYRKSDILKILAHNYTMLKITGKSPKAPPTNKLHDYYCRSTYKVGAWQLCQNKRNLTVIENVILSLRANTRNPP